MRIKRITPRVFGRFTTDSPLDIPGVPLVVVYGQNESGKSTYMDMAITLLSSDYDTRQMERYGGADTGSFSGSIVLEEEDQLLTVEFGRNAKVPGRSSDVPRKPSDAGSDIWTKIEKIKLATVRNLFRVSATDISDGLQTKKKFKEYGFGDRSGHSVTGALQSLRGQADTARKNADGLEARLSQLSRDLTEVQTTSAEYERLVADIAAIEEQIGAKKEAIQSHGAEIELVQFCNGAAASHSKAVNARANLDTAEKNGVLVPVSFGSVKDTLLSLNASLARVDLSAVESRISEIKKKSDEVRTSVASDLQSIGFEQNEFEQNSVLASDVDRQRHFADVRSAIAALNQAQVAAGAHDVSVVQAEFDDKTRAAVTARETWAKFGTGITAQEYLTRPRPAPSPVPVVTVTQASPRNRFLLAAAAVAAAAGSLAVKQYVGAAVLAVLAAVIFLRRPRQTASSGPAAVVIDDASAETVNGAALDVTAAESAESAAKTNLEAARARQIELTERVGSEMSRVGSVLAGIGLGGRTLTDPKQFDAIAVVLDKIAAGLADAGRQASALSAAETELNGLLREFSDLRDAVVENLAGIGVQISAAQFPSPGALVAHVNAQVNHYEEQSKWREAIAEHESVLAQKNADSARVSELLDMDEHGRNEALETARSRARQLEGEITSLNQRMTELTDRADELATSHRITEINLEIGESSEQLREERAKQARLEHLAMFVEERAKVRAEQSRPELHRRVQEMALAVAEDWQSIEFLEDEETVMVTYKNGRTVPDIYLSTGARTLLFTAMRIAIMQQEAEDPVAPSLPLLCDDPLVHLDDHRITQAFTMMRDQATGHQIIYFTCKQEIVDMAKSHGVTVVSIN